MKRLFLRVASGLSWFDLDWWAEMERSKRQSQKSRAEAESRDLAPWFRRGSEDMT